MARLPRLALANLPHHIIQRGNNGTEIFVDAQDRQTMLDLLREMSRRFAVDVHAYVLMPNHFHLLVTPKMADGLPQFMQAVGRSYVRYFNNRHGRSGTMWEGRYRCTVLQAETWLIPTMVSMDLNPVRAGLVARASDWVWSSYAHNAGLKNDVLISPHARFWVMGNTPFARDAAYVAAVEAGVGRDEQEQISHAALRGWALGDPLFIENLQQKTERRVTRGRAGRPPKAVQKQA
ncbi:MAG: transposase [Comamonas sp.]|uniref:transposase n=1 Tax=Comamonas sp. TaxID=34028 RepID=UPI0028222D18|nr:transposase [Comamonas sp.]MDR0213556.1 transposase [Comamonas sp.]MDR2298999.1 transposase [Comamonas sp.]